jgi:Protein of unknown function (DUF3592)
VPKFFFYLLGLIGIVFLLAGSVLFFTQVLRGRKQTEAEILRVAVEAFQNHDEGQTFTSYRAKYEVRYQAGGRTYQIPLRGNLVSASAEEASRKSANNPVGSLRPIYYLPDRPEDVSLDPLGRRIGFSLLFASIGLSVLACAVLLWLQARPLDW